MDGLNHGKVQRIPRYFSEEFKRKVCEEYLSGGTTKTALMAKYDIRGKSAILNWLRRYGYTGNGPVDTQATTNVPLMENQGNNSPGPAHALHDRIKELEKELEKEKLEKEALRTLIEVAEREYKLDIRKKPNTKQSSK